MRPHARFMRFLCNRFVYRISCRDPRPPRQRPSRPNTKRPTVRCSKTVLCCVLEPAASSQQPATTSQQRLPRSAPATPTVVTPQRPAADVRRPYVASLRPDDTRTGSDRAGVGARCRDVFYFGTRFVNRIGCRDPRPQRQRPPRPTPNDRTQDPRQLWFSVRIVLQFLFWRPLRQPHQLPRSAAATPTAVHAFCHVCRNGVGRPTLARAHWLSYQTAATATAVRLHIMNNSEA